MFKRYPVYVDTDHLGEFLDVLTAGNSVHVKIRPFAFGDKTYVFSLTRRQFRRFAVDVTTDKLSKQYAV